MEEQFQQKRLNYNTRRRQQRASETEEGWKERLKKRDEKDRERRVQHLQKKRSQDEDSEVQDLAVLK